MFVDRQKIGVDAALQSFFAFVLEQFVQVRHVILPHAVPHADEHSARLRNEQTNEQLVVVLMHVEIDALQRTRLEIGLFSHGEKLELVELVQIREQVRPEVFLAQRTDATQREKQTKVQRHVHFVDAFDVRIAQIGHDVGVVIVKIRFVETILVEEVRLRATWKDAVRLTRAVVYRTFVACRSLCGFAVLVGVILERRAIIHVENAWNFDLDLDQFLFDQTPRFEQPGLIGRFVGDDLPWTRVEMFGCSTDVTIDFSVHGAFEFGRRLSFVGAVRWLMALIALDVPFAFQSSFRDGVR